MKNMLLNILKNLINLILKAICDCIQFNKKDNEKIIIALINADMVSGKELNNIPINMVKVCDLFNLHYIGLAKDYNNPQGMPLYFSWGQIKVFDSAIFDITEEEKKEFEKNYKFILKNIHYQQNKNSMNKGFDYLIYSDKMLDVDKYGV